jgi:hypothetical protein
MGKHFMIELKPGMRVRCVSAINSFPLLKNAQEYLVKDIGGDYFLIEYPRAWFRMERFKPIVRVKALTANA